MFSRFDIHFQEYTQTLHVLCLFLNLYTKTRDVVYNSADYTQQCYVRHNKVKTYTHGNFIDLIFDLKRLNNERKNKSQHLR